MQLFRAELLNLLTIRLAKQLLSNEKIYYKFIGRVQRWYYSELFLKSLRELGRIANRKIANDTFVRQKVALTNCKIAS